LYPARGGNLFDSNFAEFVVSLKMLFAVIPAKAGIQISSLPLKAWTPACAGVTGQSFLRLHNFYALN